MVAFLECSAGARVRTNNHVEHANRRLRFDEKVRYKIRTEFAGVMDDNCISRPTTTGFPDPV